MRIVADLHIHSRFSLATSPAINPALLERWARIKGIGLLGTGDCTHPAWLAELQERLEPAEDGLFRLADCARSAFDSGEALAEDLPDPSRFHGRSRVGSNPFDHADDPAPRFVLTGEICTIYSRDGRTRKVHHLVILPSFAAAAAFQARLERVGTITSDGRPILGIDARDLFAVLLDSDDRSILVPAHIWTPWFSALGARSGFDSIDECYGDLSPRIGAIETGLSSNPPMNWAVSSLDRFSIVSNSDAHSPEKLGREATVLDMEMSYDGIAQALSGGGPSGRIVETIEFYPQEGKYHYDGHRACGIVLSPDESAQRGGICPVCGKPLTPGVLRRVAELADRAVDETEACPAEHSGTNRRPYRSLIPLKELLAELLGLGSGSKKVAAAYRALAERAGSELALLVESSEADIEAMSRGGAQGGVSGELLAAAIGRMRAGNVSIEPGYDGEYGVIRAFAPGERFDPRRKEAGLFGDLAENARPSRPEKTPRRRGGSARQAGAIDEHAAAAKKTTADAATAGGSAPRADESASFRLDPAQEAAVNHRGGPALIVAGPGSGKTAVLALRAARLVEGGLPPSAILALTFTNKAALELGARIGRSLGAERASTLTAATFHSFCLSVLRERAAEASIPPDFTVLDESERYAILQSVAGGPARARKLGAYIEGRKRFLLLPGDSAPRLGPGAPDGLLELAGKLGLPPFDEESDRAYADYRDKLRLAKALDFDDLVAGTARLLAARPEALAAYRRRFRAVFVDEYQDVNFAQYALMRLLAPGNSSELCVIGDPDQAIYGFRGSDRRFIGRFLEDYPGASIYRLTRSFRCAPAIIRAAGRLVDAELVGTGAAVALFRSEFPTDKSEAEGIARAIDRLIGGTRFFAYDSGVAGAQDPAVDGGLRSLADCAILVRAAALAAPIGKALLDHGIPYRLIGERPWWEEEPSRSAILLLRSRRPSLAPADAVRYAIGQLSGTVIESPTTSDANESAERLAAYASLYRDLASFLDALALGSPQDGYEPRTERVSLLTVHASKGLEFDHVFVAGLEEGILPFTLFEERDGDGAARLAERIEEERRLLYVAMTRARIGLHLSWARSRSFRGRELALPPSRFLEQLEDFVPMLEQAPPRPRDRQLGLF
jgi:uncharacterized protein (TIGR00375 family)